MLSVNVAIKPTEQEQGLKNNSSLPESEGLLIILPRAIKTGVWMKDTTIPLSVAYIDQNFIISEIKKLTPLSEKFELAQSPIQFILEVNQHWFEKRSISRGQPVEIKEIDTLIKLAQPRQIGFRK